MILIFYVKFAVKLWTLPKVNCDLSFREYVLFKSNIDCVKRIGHRHSADSPYALGNGVNQINLVFTERWLCNYNCVSQLICGYFLPKPKLTLIFCNNYIPMIAWRLNQKHLNRTVWFGSNFSDHLWHRKTSHWEQIWYIIIGKK